MKHSPVRFVKLWPGAACRDSGRRLAFGEPAQEIPPGTVGGAALPEGRSRARLLLIFLLDGILQWWLEHAPPQRVG